MKFFSRNKRNTEQMAIRMGPDGLYAASVRHELAAKPNLEFLSFYPGSTADSKLLLERLAKETPARKKTCSALLNFGEYQLLAIEAMNVPAQELRGAVKWRVKEMIDFPISDATVDVLSIPGDVANGGRNQSLMAVVAKNQVVKYVQDSFVGARLPLTVIDIPEMAQRNISTFLETSGRGLAMLSFGGGGGLLTVTYEGELYLSRKIDVSLEQLQSEDTEAQAAVFERVSLELQRSLDHFERQHNYITNAKLVLSPIGECAEMLRSYLSSNVYMPVELLDLSTLINMNNVPELRDPAQQQRFFEIIGAALRREPGAI